MKGLIKEKFFISKKNIPYILYGILVTACFIIFQQADLFHTSSLSYAYLKGHFVDFYDYNMSIVGRSDYLPLIYIIFAIWNIPLKIFGVMRDISQTGITLSPGELIWSKLLLVVFFAGTTYMIYKIAKLITQAENKSKWIAAIFATSPIAIFAVFIFGQYDIIGLFFTMVGFYFYIKKDYVKFSIFFSLAISLKFFAILIFIPLILLSNKKIIDILKYSLVGTLATLVQVIIYLGNEAFTNGFFSLATSKATSLNSWNISLLNNSPYLIIGFCVICVYSYIKELNNDNYRNKVSIFVTLISYSLLFSTVSWHPQWLIILMPFFSLAYIYIKDTEKMYMLDIVGMFAFIYITVNFYSNNVDVSMVTNGVLRDFFGSVHLINKDIFISKFTYIFEGVFFIYLFSPILAYYFGKRNATNDDLNTPNDDLNTPNCTKRNFYLRLYLGVGIFVISSMFCVFAPKGIAERINPYSYSVIGRTIEAGEQVVGPIEANTQIEQSIIAEQNYLKQIDIRLATYARQNNCTVNLSLLDEDNNIMAQKEVDAATIKDNEFFSFKFKPIKESKERKYHVIINSDADQNNAITAWATSNDTYPEGECRVNSQTISGDLNIRLIYDIVD